MPAGWDMVDTMPECLDGPEGCGGEVAFHWTGGTRAFPRCDVHFEERFEEQERVPLMSQTFTNPNGSRMVTYQLCQLAIHVHTTVIALVGGGTLVKCIVCGREIERRARK